MGCGGFRADLPRQARAGELPALASRLASNAAPFAGGVWPTFYTSRDVAWHGLYHNKLWRQEAMRCEITDEGWVAATPFWELLDRRFRVAVLGVPMTVASPKPLNGVHLAGWGTHDVIARGSTPAELWAELTAKIGKPRMPAEQFGPQSPRTLGPLPRQLNVATNQLTAALDLLRQGPWDLFAVVFGATHRGSHYLWNRGAAGAGSDPLLEVYRAYDRALGRLLAAAPADARIMVFAVHGMGPNTRAFPLPMDHAGYVRVNLRGREPSGIVSPEFGELPSGRAGNHRSEGWFVAAGLGIAADGSVEGHHIMDLVPTACAWLGADLGRHFHGRAIGALWS